MCSSAAVTLGSCNNRCGYGPRLPLLVISPYTKANYVSNNLTDQSSVINFIEDNWLHGAAASARAPSTRPPAAWMRPAACSTSTPGRTSSR